MSPKTWTILSHYENNKPTLKKQLTFNYLYKQKKKFVNYYQLETLIFKA